MSTVRQKMEKSGKTGKNGGPNGNNHHQYTIPPPHAHSLINKREGSLMVNTEIKQQDHHHNQQQQQQQQQQRSASPVSTYSTATETLNGSKMRAENGVMMMNGEHEIKFTKTEGCTPSTCICVFIAIILISIGASSGIYYGLRSYEDTLLKDQVFKGQFTVTRGDSYNPAFKKRSSDEFRDTAKLYKERLDKLFNESGLSKVFRRSEILALEKAPKPRSDDLVVHFNIVFSPLIRPRLNPTDVYLILIEEVRSGRKKAMKNITIDPDSIDILERKSDGARQGLFYTSSPSFPASAQFLENSSPWEGGTRFPGLLEGLTTEPTPPPRRCYPIELAFCKTLPYNQSSYPNIVGHWNISSVEEDFIPYRVIIDSECYPLAREFICQLVQPECERDEMIPPCQDFCEDFVNSCKNWIPKNILTKIKCKEFPMKEVVVDDKSSNETRRDNQTDHSTSEKQQINRKCRAKPSCINEATMPGLI